MAIGTTTLGSTPCCGAIIRNWETWVEHGVVFHQWETTWRGERRVETSKEAPSFSVETHLLDRGRCPDCNKTFR